MQCLDDLLVDSGSIELMLPWARLHLLDDGQHFTPRAQMAFELAVGLELQQKLRGWTPRSVLILADSIVGHHDVYDGEWHGSASRRLAKEVGARLGCFVCVDAVCGSGFVARAEHKEHFRARLSHKTGRRGTRDWDVVVAMGGWNDDGTDPTRLQGAVDGWVRRHRPPSRGEVASHEDAVSSDARIRKIRRLNGAGSEGGDDRRVVRRFGRGHLKDHRVHA